MTQTPAKRITSRGDAIDYTPTSNVAAGDVVEVGSIPLVATQAIVANTLGSLACEGVFDVPKTTDVFAVGDAVYWNSSGTCVGSNTGAADNATGNIMGLAVANAANNATHVRAKLTAAKRTNTIAGSVTADDITGSDSSLGITGMAGTNNSNAGKPVVVAGGAPYAGSAGAGGAASLLGGNGANNGGVGGAVAVTGGAAKKATVAGGAVAVTGGAGLTSGAGGAASLVGGAGGNNGSGGAVSITGGAGGLQSGTGGALTLKSGAGDGTNGTAGAVVIDSGNGATKGAVTIATNAATLTLGKMPRVPVHAVTASNNAAALSEGICVVTTDDNTKKVELPAPVAGAQLVVVNRNSALKVQLHASSGKTVNAIASNNSVELAANTVTHCYATGNNSWVAG